MGAVPVTVALGIASVSKRRERRKSEWTYTWYFSIECTKHTKLPIIPWCSSTYTKPSWCPSKTWDKNKLRRGFRTQALLALLCKRESGSTQRPNTLSPDTATCGGLSQSIRNRPNSFLVRLLPWIQYQDAIDWRLNVSWFPGEENLSDSRKGVCANSRKEGKDGAWKTRDNSISSLLKLPFLTGTKPLSSIIHSEITLKSCVLNSSILKHDLGKPELK